jgi:hypothetical protein
MNNVNCYGKTLTSTTLQDTLEQFAYIFNNLATDLRQHYSVTQYLIGDVSFQWERSIFSDQPIENPLADENQIWHN